VNRAIGLMRQGQESLSEQMASGMWGSREFLLQVKGHVAPDVLGQEVKR